MNFIINMIQVFNTKHGIYSRTCNEAGNEAGY